jgi:hypothetical protein
MKFKHQLSVSTVLSLFITYLLLMPLKQVQAENTSEMSVTLGKIIISGSTNIGSWDCRQADAEGTIRMNVSESGHIINSLEITIPVASFSDCNPPAGPSSGQERAVHKYLKAEEHPYATFTLHRTEPRTISSAAIFHGELTIAGVTKPIRAAVRVSEDNGNFTITGIQELKMTEFEIKPPTGLLGTIRSRDDVKVDYEIAFE